ncbi:MAG: hypothetical protein GY909_07380 [Oligoflexia bacterium]|nr:hypothetical protein [Oligoflexia bacterium]
MKKLILFLSFISLFSAKADLIQTVKVSDGTLALCQKKTDVYRGREGAYNLKAVAGIRTSEGVILRLRITSLKCTQKKGKFGFKLENLLASSSYNSHGNEIVVDTIDATLKGYVDGEYKLLTEKALQDRKVQAETVFIANEDLVSDNSIKSVDFFVTKLKQYENKTNGYQFKKSVNYGLFRVRFRMTNNTVELLD